MRRASNLVGDTQEAHYVANSLLETPAVTGHERDPLLGSVREGSEEAVGQNDELEDGELEEVKNEAWTKSALTIAYSSLFLMASCVSLEGQTVISLSAYATSAFKKHAMLSTVLAIQGVINAVVKAPMAKFANVFGRLETYIFVVSIYVLGYALMAGAPNFQTYAAGQIFYSTGSTSLQISQQIFIADTTNLLNRALFTRLPDIPYLFTVWIGPWCAEQILKNLNWRWGYGIWAVLLPLTSIPLIGALANHRLRMKKISRGRRLRLKQDGIMPTIYRYSRDLDLAGFVLFTSGLSLTLIPVSLVNSTKKGFGDSNVVVPFVLGCVCLVVFVYHETKVAASPLVPLHLFRVRSVVAGCALAFWYFMAFYFSVQPYLFSYLQVVHSMSVSTAGRITQTFGFMATVSAVIISLFIRRTRRYRRFVILGCCIYVVGLLSMLLYRTESASAASILASQVIVGMGGGIVNVSVQVGIQASIDQADVAAATAMFLTALEMGGAVGSAISGAIWTRVLPTKLAEHLPPGNKHQAHEIFEEISKALSYPQGSMIRKAIDQSYQETMDILMLTAICIALVIIPLGMSMRTLRLPER